MGNELGSSFRFVSAPTNSRVIPSEARNPSYRLMATKAKFQAIKGTRDLLPPETELWNRVEQSAHEVFATFGFGEIRPPIFEPTDLFARAVGGETDIVSKEMYSFEDRDDTSVSLRPEATASVCRAYIEHNMQQLPAPVKLYYLGPMFRRERPQKGRYRQFYQIGAEILGGSDAPGIDAQVIEMVMSFFARLGLEGVQLEINSIGHNAPECRRGYVEKLKAALQRVKDHLGEDSKRRIETNPLRVLDSKLESEQAVIANLPRIADHLCDECAKHYQEVKQQLELRGVAFKENWRLVRGLDYYMRTTFEITAKGLGSQNAVCGGGRYDGLVELLGGPPTKGIGFAIGEDRLVLSLQEAGKGSVALGRDVYIAWMGEKAQRAAIAVAQKLRNAGFRVELPPTEQKFGKALGQADKLGSRYALILGEDEVTSGHWTLKTLADGSQQKYTETELLEFLSKQKQLSS
jgi:histidyl-tRNA synthetase